MDVTSFGINHDLLLRGIYVSRVDEIGSGYVTSFDVRMKEPNREPVMDTAVMHALEHLIAVFFRSNREWADQTIYVGPMGCRTGMYFLFKGNLKPEDILDVVRESFQYVIDFEGEIPAAKPEMCGNYLDHNLTMAQWESRKFMDEILTEMKSENMVYPTMNYDRS